MDVNTEAKWLEKLDPGLVKEMGAREAERIKEMVSAQRRRNVMGFVDWSKRDLAIADKWIRERAERYLKECDNPQVEVTSK